MTTRAFPLLRGLRRVLAGGAVKHKPAIAPTERRCWGQEEGANDGDAEEGSRGPRPPDGCRSNSSGDGDEGVRIDDPRTWPINSERARGLRRDFVQEGHRRIYDAAAGRGVVGVVNAVGNNDEIEENGVQYEAGEWRSATDSGRYDVDEHEMPRAHSINGDEDWLYYAQ